MGTQKKFTIAYTLYQEKHYKQAFDMYMELEAQGFKNYEMFIQLGHIYFHQKELSNAYQKYHLAYEMDKLNAYPLMRMLKCHDYLNQPVEMFMEDHLIELIKCKNFTEKELRKIKLVYQKQGKENQYDEIEKHVFYVWNDFNQKKLKINELEEIEKKVEKTRFLYESNINNVRYLASYMGALNELNDHALIKETLDKAYHNINHFEVDYLYAKYYLDFKLKSDAMQVIKRMEARLKKHEDAKKMIKFYEYQKLADLYQI